MSIIEKVKTLQTSECIVDFLLKEITQNKCNECGKCVFGYEGITQLRLIFRDISEKKGKNEDFSLLQELCGFMQTESLCETGIEIAEAVKYGLAEYEEEIKRHIGKKGCSAGVCRKFVTYHILAAKCIGCGDCADECEEDAIAGKKKFVHVIEQDECIQCGACLDICEEDAIIAAGTIKPRCPKKPIPCK